MRAGNGIDGPELQPEADAHTRNPLATLEWARRWPTEEVWKARKVG
jgi:hypothetical protein